MSVSYFYGPLDQPTDARVDGDRHTKVRPACKASWKARHHSRTIGRSPGTVQNRRTATQPLDNGARRHKKKEKASIKQAKERGYISRPKRGEITPAHFHRRVEQQKAPTRPVTSLKPLHRHKEGTRPPLSMGGVSLR
ncbi:hypothetical protein, unlikely [Trypanosoma congolense IL3000]|uniref:Uncharacterized protein n=1 Tax=Trypanosoma congolense (strain IL3000) TaxID=1068625 RepID=F9WCD0_TRYCI|nr:hypothetical protein, unlikely [Trypanosoma congolense IL3000]